jgi:hypothetical protein
MILQIKPRHTITQSYNHRFKKKKIKQYNILQSFLPLQQPSTIRNNSPMEHK